MLFFSFFKTLVDQEVTVELKNDIEIRGTLKTVDQYLNLKLDNVICLNEDKYPHMQSVKNLFIRGSTVRYVHMSSNTVDCTLLQDASRRGMYNFFALVVATNTNFRGYGSVGQVGIDNPVLYLQAYSYFRNEFESLLSLCRHRALEWPVWWQNEQVFFADFLGFGGCDELWFELWFEFWLLGLKVVIWSILSTLTS